MLTRERIAALLPYGPSMVLLDRVESTAEDSIVCYSRCHREPGSPLRRGGSLPAAAALELAAQAVALHGTIAGGECVRGMLVLARDVRFGRGDLDVEEDELRIEVQILRRSGAGCTAAFAVGPRESRYVEGRIGILFGAPDARN